jgi:hypothetical protein
MSDFVITGEQLHDFIRLNESGIKRLQDEIRSHPLASELESAYKNGFNDGQAEGMPEALKAERGRWLTQDELQSMFSILDAFIERTGGTQECRKLFDKIESMIGEP